MSEALAVALVFVQPEWEQRNIDVSKIQPNPHQPRRIFEPVALAELGQSIKEKGVLQPISVIDISAAGVEAYQIVTGERRWRACELIGRPTIPGLIVKADDQDSAEMAVIENLQRVNLRPIEEARGFAVLLDYYEGNKTRVAERIGKSLAFVVNDRLALLELPEEVQNMIDLDQLNVAQAKVLLEISDPAEQVKWAKQAHRRSLNADKLHGMTQNLMAAGSGKRQTSGDKRERRATFKGVVAGMISLYEDSQALEADKLTPEQRQTLVQQGEVLIGALQELGDKLGAGKGAEPEA